MTADTVPVDTRTNGHQGSLDEQDLRQRSLSGPGAVSRKQIFNRIDRERGRLWEIENKHQAAAKECADIAELLRRAEETAHHHSLTGRFAKQEFAWSEIHEAEARIDRLLIDGELLASSRDLLAKASETLPPDDPRVLAVKEPLESRSRPDSPFIFIDRAAVEGLARAVEDKIDEGYAQTRTFRNRLVLMILMCLATLGLMLWGLSVIGLSDGFIINPPVGESTIALLIALFGAVGGLISMVPAAARTGGTWNPFHLPMYQLGLKVALAPIFAVVGVLLLSIGGTPSIGPDMTLAELLVWSVGFGVAQQTVTRLVDRRVKGLVSTAAADTPEDDRGMSSFDPAPRPIPPSAAQTRRNQPV